MAVQPDASERIQAVPAPRISLWTRVRASWALLRGGAVVVGVGYVHGSEICVRQKHSFLADNVELEPGQHLSETPAPNNA